jgi:hypothetical protein
VAYASLQDVRSWLGVADTFDDPELALALDTAHAAVNAHVGFGFDLEELATPKLFMASSPKLLDIAAQSFTVGILSGLIVRTDADDDGVFETLWTSADWQTEPINSVGPGGAVWPATALRAVGDYRWPVGGTGRARVQITAKWGWPAVPSRVRMATIMLTAAWHQRRATMTGRSNFDGFFASAIADDQTITDLLAPFRHGTAVVGVG